ncbi:dimethylsulfonioproprionate lyase family protein [Labrys okinawensis]|uniref:dimethylsulfonioproprionate lyase family protein n=1 Tax=Labrys okinawensis TaxID=346911 RepID=UPI0039BC3468
MSEPQRTEPSAGPVPDALLARLFGEIGRLLVGEADFARPFMAALPQEPFRRQPGDGEAFLPVLRDWPDCLARAPEEQPALASVTDALSGLSPFLRWRQNPNYRVSPPNSGFLDGYGYSEIAGPYGLVEGGIRCGVLLLGPHIFYPAHRHPAEEIYIPLNLGAWQRGEAEIVAGGWTDRPAGAVIHHPPGVPHAMRAGERALAALYLWRGDLATEARLDAAGAAMRS